MNEIGWERFGAASGFVMVVTGAAASVFERTPVTAADYAADRVALQTQSMLFLAGSAAALWFLGSLRSFLRRAEGGTGRLSDVVLGSGVAWVTVNIVAQAFQIGVAADPSGTAPAALLKTMSAVFTVANLPLALMLVAVAVVSLRHHAFPVWVSYLSLVAAAAQALLWISTVIPDGPLSATGWLSFALYPVFLIWLVPATMIMIRAPRSPRPGQGVPDHLTGR